MNTKVCMNCGEQKFVPFLDLGIQPNGNNFPLVDEAFAEPQFPFRMGVCTKCWQVQIEEFPSPEFMFSNHPYVTGFNTPIIQHFKKLVKDVLNKFPLAKNGLVVDIGANDGSLLREFSKAGMRVIGVDPGKRTGEIAKKNGVTVCETFWDEEAANALKKLNLRPDIITATAVFYHIENIHSFVRGLSKVMNEDSVFVTQCIYLKDVLEKLQFDHFYHEHTMVHSLAPLERLFALYGLRMVDVDFYDVHGGSFVLYVVKNESNYASSSAIEDALRIEAEAGLSRLDTYYSFAKGVDRNRVDLVALLNKLKSEGKKVYALGAPLKGSTLLNYCQIGPELIQLAVEVNPFKVGRLIPGVHIPIVHEDEISDIPDYYLILSWNFLDFFIEKYSSYLSGGGSFILPHPMVSIMGDDLTRKCWTVEN